MISRPTGNHDVSALLDAFEAVLSWSQCGPVHKLGGAPAGDEPGTFHAPACANPAWSSQRGPENPLLSQAHRSQHGDHREGVTVWIRTRRDNGMVAHSPPSCAVPSCAAKCRRKVRRSVLSLKR